MYDHSFENEFNLLVNEISFSAARLALRKRLKVIRNWLIPKDVKMFFIKVGPNIVIFVVVVGLFLFFLCVCVCVCFSIFL